MAAPELDRAPTPGVVALVGAGPGDAGLLTLRGRALLDAADVVVYEHRRQRALIPPNAGRYFVGARRDGARPARSAVRQLVVALAREGRTVVYLLRGDPFSFGRGSEVAQALHDAGIPFEVVPGVATGVAAASYAGIPLVSPSLAATTVFASGRELAKHGAVSTDWAAVARLGGTVVVRDAAPALDSIVAGFAAAGVPPEIPTAIVSHAGASGQRAIVGTLETIGSDVSRAGGRYTLIIGWTVLLRDELAWFERRPLFGRRIVVARAPHASDTVSDRLRELGAVVLETPIPRVARLDVEPLRTEVERLAELEWIVFGAPEAVDAFWEQLLGAGRDTRALGGARIAAVGAATAAALLDRGVTVDVVQERFGATALVDVLTEHPDIPGAALLSIGDEESAESFASDLESTGATVTWVAPYRAVPAERREASFRRMLERRGADLVVATSAPAAASYARAAGETLAASIPAAATSADTAAALRDAGAEVVIETTAGAEEIVRAIRGRLERTPEA